MTWFATGLRITIFKSKNSLTPSLCTALCKGAESFAHRVCTNSSYFDLCGNQPRAGTMTRNEGRKGRIPVFLLEPSSRFFPSARNSPFFPSTYQEDRKRMENTCRCLDAISPRWIPFSVGQTRSSPVPYSWIPAARRPALFRPTLGQTLLYSQRISLKGQAPSK